MTFISEKERIFGGLFGAAAGDAIGLTYEGMRPAKRCNLRVAGGGQFGLAAGAVTDDTMMMLALLQTYLSCGRFDRDAFLRRMTETVRRDPVSFGRTTKTLCTLLEQGCFPEEAVRAVDVLFGSRTYGSVMRTLSVGLVCDPRTAAAEARRVSAFTHFDPAAGDCCAAVSTAAAVLLAGGERDVALQQQGLPREERICFPATLFRRLTRWKQPGVHFSVSGRPHRFATVLSRRQRLAGTRIRLQQSSEDLRECTSAGKIYQKSGCAKSASGNVLRVCRGTYVGTCRSSTSLRFFFPFGHISL